jgi:hypothetical protein
MLQSSALSVMVAVAFVASITAEVLPVCGSGVGRPAWGGFRSGEQAGCFCETPGGHECFFFDEANNYSFVFRSYGNVNGGVDIRRTSGVPACNLNRYNTSDGFYQSPNYKFPECVRPIGFCDPMKSVAVPCCAVAGCSECDTYLTCSNGTDRQVTTTSMTVATSAVAAGMAQCGGTGGWMLSGGRGSGCFCRSGAVNSCFTERQGWRFLGDDVGDLVNVCGYRNGTYVRHPYLKNFACDELLGFCDVTQDGRLCCKHANCASCPDYARCSGCIDGYVLTQEGTCGLNNGTTEVVVLPQCDIGQRAAAGCLCENDSGFVCHGGNYFWEDIDSLVVRGAAVPVCGVNASGFVRYPYLETHFRCISLVGFCDRLQNGRQCCLMANCTRCDTFTTCSQCAPGLMLNDGECVPMSITTNRIIQTSTSPSLLTTGTENPTTSTRDVVATTSTFTDYTSHDVPITVPSSQPTTNNSVVSLTQVFDDTSPSGSDSNWFIYLIVAVVVLCLALVLSVAYLRLRDRRNEAGEVLQADGVQMPVRAHTHSSYVEVLFEPYRPATPTTSTSLFAW